MADTHINAFVEEARESVEAAKAAVNDAEEKLNALVAKVHGANPEEQEAPAGPGPASEGEAESKSKKVKYR